MKDAIGQEIKVGDKVFHSGSRTVEAGVYDVKGLTERTVRVLKPKHQKSNGYYRPKDKAKPAIVAWRPGRLVVVTGNLIRLALDVSENPVCDYCGRNPLGEDY